VKIVGDSHLRGTAARIDHYLNRKSEVCSWIKPGANTEELVDILDKDLKCLGKKDVIVINGGANDIGSKRNQINRVLVKMTQFIQKYKKRLHISGSKDGDGRRSYPCERYTIILI
jgi:lysophospholipase L1-like esterase